MYYDLHQNVSSKASVVQGSEYTCTARVVLITDLRRDREEAQGDADASHASSAWPLATVGHPWAISSNIQGTQPLRRLHIKATDASKVQLISSNTNLLSRYNLLSITPTTEAMLQQACNALPVDIISIPLGQGLPYRLTPGALQPAVARGIHFEICYADPLTSPGSRKQFFANAMQLTKALRGRNIILSSGADIGGAVRSPSEVVAMGPALGLTHQQAEAALSLGPSRVLQHAIARRQIGDASGLSSSANPGPSRIIVA